MPTAFSSRLESFRAFIRLGADQEQRVTHVTDVTVENTKACELQAFVTRVTGNGIGGDAADGEARERQAIAEVEGGVPALYSPAFATLQMTPPAGVSVPRWLALVDEAGRFLDAFGEQAAALGWSERDLFGRGGLILSLDGTGVVALTADSVTLSDGRILKRVSRSENPQCMRIPGL
ncbi:MAG TPA: hypothetical protein VIL09_05465 [Microvirga sp.]|jgi:hypothetical protein